MYLCMHSVCVCVEQGDDGRLIVCLCFFCSPKPSTHQSPWTDVVSPWTHQVFNLFLARHCDKNPPWAKDEESRLCCFAIRVAVRGLPEDISEDIQRLQKKHYVYNNTLDHRRQITSHNMLCCLYIIITYFSLETIYYIE